MQRFDLIVPSSLKEILERIHNEPALKPIAGGTDILVFLHKESHIEQLKAQPQFIDPQSEKVSLIDLTQVDELQGISKNGSWVEIKPCTTHAELASNDLIKEYYPILAQAAGQIGSPQIRNRGTIGGNVVHASPAADTVPPLFVLRAEVVLTSLNHTRQLPIAEFFTGHGETILEPTEILTKIMLPFPSSNHVQFYRRIAARKAHACAKASIAFRARMEKHTLSDVHVAFGAVAPTVILARKTADVLEGQQLIPQIISEAVNQALGEINPIDDIRSTGEYRRAMIGELFRQELEKLLE